MNRRPARRPARPPARRPARPPATWIGCDFRFRYFGTHFPVIPFPEIPNNWNPTSPDTIDFDIGGAVTSVNEIDRNTVALVSNLFKINLLKSWFLYRFKILGNELSFYEIRCIISRMKASLGIEFIFDGKSRLISPIELKNEIFFEEVTVFLEFEDMITTNDPKAKHIVNIILSSSAQLAGLCRIEKLLVAKSLEKLIVGNCVTNRILVFPACNISHPWKHNEPFIKICPQVFVIQEDPLSVLIARFMAPRVNKLHKVIHWTPDALKARQKFCQDQFRDLKIVTMYNGRLYVVKRIEWSQTPNNTWTYRDEIVSYFNYFTQLLGLTINQKANETPLIVATSVRSKPTDLEMECTLLPEVCYIVGLSEDMKEDWKLRNELSTLQRLSPHNKMSWICHIRNTIATNNESSMVLQNWGIEMCDSSFTFQGAKLRLPEIQFNSAPSIHWNNTLIEHREKQRGSWFTRICSRQVISGHCLLSWLIIYDIQTCSNFARIESFVAGVVEGGQKIGFQIREPEYAAVAEFNVENFAAQLTKFFPRQNRKYQAVMLVFPSRNQETYRKVKQILGDCGVPSQVVLDSNVTKFLSHRQYSQAAAYVALQLFVKLGGIPWAFSDHLSVGTFVIGICCSNFGKRYRLGKAVAAVCCRTSAGQRYQSYAHIYNTSAELITFSGQILEECLQMRFLFNFGLFPRNVVIFCTMAPKEVNMMHLVASWENVFTNFYQNRCLTAPALSVIEVGKSSNRYFKLEKNPLGEVTYYNPDPGTICQRGFYSDGNLRRDFDLISHGGSRDGSALNPGYYKLLLGGDFEDFTIARMAFHQSHMYFNYCGIANLPAVVKYAQKLSNFTAEVGQAFNNLSHKLYYI